MPTPVPPPVQHPQPKTPIFRQKKEDGMTDFFANVSKKSGRWLRLGLTATGMAAFFVWIALKLGLQQSPFHMVTLAIWLASLYLVIKINNVKY